jgi:hypothetical protein
MRVNVPSVLSAATVVAVVLALGGCPEGGNTLEGSISESFDLTFDRTQLRRVNGVTLQLDYLRDIEGSDIPDVICKIVVDTPEGGFPAGEPVSIIENNGIIERRAVGGEDFPALELANITFDVGGNDPGEAVGSFASTFDNGKTLNGTFETELEDVEF